MTGFTKSGIMGLPIASGNPVKVHADGAIEVG